MQDLKRKWDEVIDGTKFDCSKCPILREDCSKLLEVLKKGEGSYQIKGRDCILKIALRDGLKFFHL